MSPTECRCLGFDGDCECPEAASQEDGLCDGCRCEHGCCTDHGSPNVGRSRFEVIIRDLDWIEHIGAAYATWDTCQGRKAEMAARATEGEA